MRQRRRARRQRQERARWLSPGCGRRATGVLVLVVYRNHRGATTLRRIVPRRVFWGFNEWQEEPQFLMDCWDEDKGEYRTFALADCDFIAGARRDRAVAVGGVRTTRHGKLHSSTARTATPRKYGSFRTIWRVARGSVWTSATSSTAIPPTSSARAAGGTRSRTSREQLRPGAAVRHRLQEFVFGAEIGGPEPVRVPVRCRRAPALQSIRPGSPGGHACGCGDGEFRAIVHDRNAEMAIRIADAYGLHVRSEDLADGWLEVIYTGGHDG